MVMGKHIVFVLISLLIWVLPIQVAAQTKIINIRNWSAPDHTRIVIDVEEDPVYEVEKVDKKLVVELDDAEYASALSRRFLLKKPGIEKIVVTPRPENRVLIELFLTEHTETKVFKLRQIEDKPYRIVVDILLPEIEKKETEARERVKLTLKKKIVVIDPGHGGDDPGAVGKQGTYEKNVVLAISRKIRDVLNRKKGYRAFLTRDDDYYVPFKKRLKIAREYHADLFMSIHADAEKSRQAAGASVYALSLRSASSEAARILARNENFADIVGGEANGDATNDESDPIILNMFQTNTLNVSKTFGGTLLHNLSAINRIKFAAVQEAPFMVLKLPEIPSVLIETAFLSHPREEKMLRSPKFQKELAETIANSAVEFLESAPGTTAPATLVKTEETPRPEMEKNSDRKAMTPRTDAPAQTPAKSKPLLVTYKVKKGDALERIARKYGVTVEAIAESNNMKPNKPLYVDLKLKIPVSVEDETTLSEIEKSGDRKAITPRTDGPGQAPMKSKPPVVTYKVKKGDSLERIARKNGVTVAAIAELNNIKMNKPLYTGLNLKIPVSAEDETAAQAVKKTPPEKKPEVVEKKKKGSVAKKNEKQTKKFYLVKKGDTLESIARRNKTTIAALKKMNGAKKLSRLYVDQKLEIPVH